MSDNRPEHMVDLKEYRRKRDFRATPEPSGRVARGRRRGLRFVVQKHAARRLHYDFRLELEGVLKSWAVPKGPSLDPSERRLAVHVEDHPLEYGDFEGVISEGQYGGGTVLLWDEGEWIPRGDPVKSYERGRLRFVLKGEKLRGGWSLVRMSSRADEDEEERQNWLLIKSKDAEARPGAGGDVTAARPESVATGRDLDQVAEDRDRTWDSTEGERSGVGLRRDAAGKAPERDGARVESAVDPSALEGARRAPLPSEAVPQLATLVSTAPAGDDWVHELKYDGYRILGRLENGRVRLLTRTGKDWTSRMRPLADALRDLPVRQALLDGEVVVMDARGRTSFQALQNALGRGAAAPLSYVIFDIIHLDGYDLHAVPLEERKRLLAPLLPSSAAVDHEPGGQGRVRYSDHVVGRGPEVYAEACALGTEGIVSKRRRSPYTPKRTRDWVKVKCLQQQEFVVVGYTDPEGSRVGLGALLVGVYDAEGRLGYAGRVGTGFTEQTLRELRGRLEGLERKTPPVAHPPRGGGVRRVRWVRPELVASVAFTGWTDDGRLRHPRFRGMREDIPAGSVRREAPVPAPDSGQEEADQRGWGSASSQRPRRRRGMVEIAGVRLSNPGRVLYPESGITKEELARYYATVADWILPHVTRRLLTLVRCPRGHEGDCFYQKHASPRFPGVIRRHGVQESTKTRTYLSVAGIEGVVYLVQLGTLELHVWGSRVDRIERPDRMVMDLDPDPDLPWGRLVEAAVTLRDQLSQLGLESFVKTTGGKGLHVVVPLIRRHDWDEVKEFARAVAEEIVRGAPDRYTARVSKERRQGKIYVDYLRNARGATAVTAYSTRARAGATVSTPLAWAELEQGVRPDDFTVRSVPRRLEELGRDPWEGLASVRQSLTLAMRERLGLGDRRSRSRARR